MNEDFFLACLPCRGSPISFPIHGFAKSAKRDGDVKRRMNAATHEQGPLRTKMRWQSSSGTSSFRNPS